MQTAKYKTGERTHWAFVRLLALTSTPRASTRPPLRNSTIHHPLGYCVTPRRRLLLKIPPLLSRIHTRPSFFVAGRVESLTAEDNRRNPVTEKEPGSGADKRVKCLSRAIRRASVCVCLLLRHGNEQSERNYIEREELDRSGTTEKCIC